MRLIGLIFLSLQFFALNLFAQVSQYDLGYKWSQENMDSAIYYFHRALINQERVYDAYAAIADLYEESVRMDSSMKYAIKGLELAKIENNYVEQVRFYRMIGTVYNFTGEFQNSIDNLNLGLEAGQNISGDSLKSASLGELYLYGLGSAYLGIENYEKAVESYLKAAQEAKKIDNKLLLFDAYLQLGVSNFNLGNNLKANEYFELCKQLAAEVEDSKAEQHFKLASVNHSLGDYTGSIQSFYEAISEFTKSGKTYKLSDCYYMIGGNYYYLKQWDSAITHISRAVDLMKISKETDLMNSAYMLLGDINVLKGNLSLADSFLTKAIQLYEKTTDQEGLIYCYTLKSEICEKEKDMQCALENMQIAFNIKDSVNVIESVEKIHQLESKYKEDAHQNELQAQSEIAEKNEAILRLTVLIFVILVSVLMFGIILFFRKKKRSREEERKKQEQKQRILQEKLLRTQLQPHFISNALIAIQNFLVNNKSTEASQHLQDFSKLMRLILDSSRKEFIPIEDDIQIIRNYLKFKQLLNPGQFEYSIDLDDGLDEEEDMVPPMVAQPFIENSILHGMNGLKRKGMIRVSYKKVEDKIILSVEDNGVGRNFDLSKNKKSRSSHSVNITEERLEVFSKKMNTAYSLNYNDVIKNEKFMGTLVHIELPLT
ncbi:MAG: histidine kinase [Flavobacteriales bacterium]|nr:histidine kinase [Flavobacteriales bacterium]